MVGDIGRKVIKRDGRIESFNKSKIISAVKRCFMNGVKMPEKASLTIAEQIAHAIQSITDRTKDELHIEDIQRLVIQQLWAMDQFDAAEHYTIYREERRKKREEFPISQEEQDQIDADAKHFPTPLQYYQFISKFSRWREQDSRRETWKECNERVFDWFKTIPQFSMLTQEEILWLKEIMFDLKASPAMRVVQMAGPALERCHIGVYNCAAHPIIDLFAFAELLYILMQGSGNGFSVESDFISELPRIKKQKKGIKRTLHQYQIPDSTEGWCDTLYFALQKWFNGEDVEFDFSLIRQAGTPLKIKGGIASGPKPLKDLLEFVRSTIFKAQGRRLNDLEVHDICCYIGKIVQVGGVRRASCISLSDLDSRNMRDAKHGNWWMNNSQRSMANNSTAYEEKPSSEVFMEEWLALVKSQSGERGIFNRKAAIKHKPLRRNEAIFLPNPCAEIILRPFGLCNLSIAILRGDESIEEIENRIKAATYFGVIQSCCTKFNYVREEWKKNVEEERLLGVDVMGHLDHPLLKPGALNRKELVNRLKNLVADTAQSLSQIFGINYSAANTCLKPGGDSRVFFDSSNLSPYFSEYQIRRTRESIHSPVCKFLKAAGVPWEPAAEDESGLVAFSWPKRNPEGSLTRNKVTAIQQLENWLFWKQNWSEHSCSDTIYVRDDEWPEVGTWVWKHFDDITGLSFLPYDNGSYRTPPNEAITKEQYDEMVAKFPNINWAKLKRFELVDGSGVEGSKTIACSAGKCEI